MKLQDIDKEFDQKVKKIEKMTDRNDHAGAILAGLNLLGNDDPVDTEVKKIQTIMAKHEQMGHMPAGLSEDRYKIYEKMMKFAKGRLSKEQYKKFHNAF
jgi:hypothetical protein